MIRPAVKPCLRCFPEEAVRREGILEGKMAEGERTGHRNAGRNRKRQGGRRRLLPFLVLLCLLLLSGLCLGGYLYIKKYMPTKARADLGEYFDVAGNNVQVYLNEEKQRTSKSYLVVGRFQENHVYLPYEFVREKLNRRFYWQESSAAFLYTLPAETVATGEGDLLPDGSHAFFQEGKNLYLNVDWVKEYTDLRYQQNTDGEYKRIFLDNDWGAYAGATVQKKEAVRVQGGVKSPVLTELMPGTEVRILEQLEKWTKVSTPDGFQGYLRSSRLGEAREVKPESSFHAADYTRRSLPEGQKVVLGFQQVMNAAANENLDALTENTPGMNVIAPTWFVLSSSEGDFISYASADYVARAHEKGYQVWATVNNFDLGRLDEGVLLRDLSLRGQLIGGLVQNALENDIDGLNIDFELIPAELGQDYVQFMRELSVACRNAGLILSVDCYVPFSYNSHYDLEELGVFCDYVIIMCYDEHYAGSEEAGSVASISYTDRGIRETEKLVPKERIVIAVPFYTRVWITKADGSLSSEALSAKRAQQWVQEKNVTLEWQDEIGQYYGSIEDEGVRKQIWMEEAQSMGLKLSHIRAAELGGVAAWKLGQEPEGFWNILNLNQ